MSSWTGAPLDFFDEGDLRDWFTELDLSIVRAAWLSVSVPPPGRPHQPTVPPEAPAGHAEGVRCTIDGCDKWFLTRRQWLVH
eukprot:9333904-Pyramimonas_sp.AAC.1